MQFTYQETLDFLYGLQRVGIKLGLENIQALLTRLDNPQLKFKSIHIAGTNGKGSTSAMLFSILKAAGLRVGLYTSPHLQTFNERIRINEVMISNESLVEYTNEMRSAISEISPSFFEVTTAIAFRYFADQKIDIAVVETGLGGRLDATNTLNPLLTLITPIAKDHQHFLGNTFKKIAAEKAGIIKKNIPCLTNNFRKSAIDVIKSVCYEKNSQFINVNKSVDMKIIEKHFQSSIADFTISNETYERICVRLPGEHQLQNAKLALQASVLLQKEFHISHDDIYNGFSSLHWRGRIHQISESPNIVIDVSHNPEGFRKTMELINKYYNPRQIDVFTFLQKDKDVLKIVITLKDTVDTITYIKLNAGKPMVPEQFCNVFKKIIHKECTIATVDEALKTINNAVSSRLQLFIGSHYLAGAVYDALKNGETN